MIVQHWYRATSFGQPVGPWRDCLRDVRADLEADGLGSHDEYGQFYITVPGGMIRRSAWVEFEEQEHPPHAATFGRRARSHGRRW
jgi:hypothetical protein